jgi:hypothetical protein
MGIPLKGKGRMDKKLCKKVFNSIYGKACLIERIPFEQWNEMMETIEETLKSSNWIGGYPVIHCINQPDVGWKMITIDEEDGWQDLTWCIADVFGLNRNYGFAKEGQPPNIVKELAKMLEMPLAFDWGDNSGYCKTDAEEDW